MKKLLLSTVSGAACVLALVSIGAAADIPVRPPLAAPVAAPAPLLFSWTGFYAGFNGGGAWHAGNHDLFATITSDFPDFGPDGDAVTFSGRRQLNPSGGFGGGQFGFNWQRANWLFGLEADFQGADIKASQDLNVLAPFGLSGGKQFPDDATASATATSRVDAFGSVRARFGFLATPYFLIYGTGGLAFGQVRDSLTVVAVDANDPDPNERIRPLSTHTITNDGAKIGFAVGGGVEYYFPQTAWSVKAEYQFIDLGSNRLFVTSDNSADHAEATTQFDHRYHTFRIGVNYHF